MGVFYNDPQPVQRTPRLPASAFTSGSQPPRTAVAGAIAMACVLSSWPAQGEPPLNQQNLHPRQIAPLPLVYGQQPPRIDAMPKVQYRTAVVSWPDDREPRLQFNNQQPERRYIVALTLTYGQQPRPSGALSPTEVSKLIRWWEQPFQLPQELPSVAPFFVPPIVNNPPINGATTPQELALVRSAWDPPFQYPESEPPGASWNVPATQSYVAPNKSPGWVIDAWRIPDGDIQFSGGFTPDTLGDQPPIAGAITPQEMALVRYATEPARSEPPRLVKIIPLAQGQQPPVQGPLTVTELQILSMTALWWPGQAGSDSASWNTTPAVVNNPPGRNLPQFIARVTWEPPFVYPLSEADNAAWNVGPLSPIVAFTRARPHLSTQSWWAYVQPEQGRRWIASLLFVPGAVADTTTIYGPFQILADRLVISDPSSRVVNSTLGYSATFTDPASRLLIVTEEP